MKTEFEQHMASHGYESPEIIPDGNIHRFSSHGRKDKSAWYVFYSDGPAGAFGNWATNENHTWHGNGNGKTLSERQRKKIQAEILKAKQARIKERAACHKSAAERAQALWEKAKPASNDDLYLKKKGVMSHGLRIHKNALVVPVYDSKHNLKTLQFIGPDGKKRFLKNGKKKGCAFTIKGKGRKIYLAEGYATGATVHKATGGTVVICFDSGNLGPVADSIRDDKPKAEIIICGDHDRWTNGNPGLKAAREAATRNRAKLTYPQFKDVSSKPTDFNDLYLLEGINIVKEQIDRGNKKTSGTTRTVAELKKRFATKVEYLYREHIPCRLPVILAGREGSGKSAICMSIVEHVLEENPERNVLWIAAEGTVQDVIIKAEQQGVHSSRLRILENAENSFEFNFQRADSLKILSDQMEILKPILVVIDSVRGMTSLSENDDRIGHVLQAVHVRICDRHGASLIFIDHHKKGAADNGLDKIAGSTAKPRAVRLVMSVTAVSAYKRNISVVKNNITGILGLDLYSLKEGEKVKIYEEKTQSDESKVGKAEALILDIFLDRTKVLAKDVYRLGEKISINSGTMKQAKQKLGIASHKDGEWYWIWKK